MHTSNEANNIIKIDDEITITSSKTHIIKESSLYPPIKNVVDSLNAVGVFVNICE